MARLSPILLALLCASASPVPTLGAEEPSGVLTRPPAVVAPADPEYPADAKAEGLTGTVTLELEISETGEVTDAVVTGPAGHGFDEAALAAARRLRFSPAEIDGKPSVVRIEYRFDFVLREEPPAVAAPPPVNLRGRVLERGTRLPIAAALVQAGETSTYTDSEGRFALTVPLGEAKVSVTDAAHARFEVVESVYEGKVTEVTYWLRRTALSSNETVVTGKKERREVSHQAIAAGEIRRIAGVSGDTVKVVQNLPGVARSPFGSGQLVVRGGNPRDTRVYVDGLQVPAVFHFGGLTSIYSSELVKEVEFQAGNFGVTSGRAIGGRVNLVTRDPGERTHTLADVNLYQGTALWEGRASDGVGLAVAARRSYVDLVLSQAMKQADDGPELTVAPRFYDLQAKGTWKLGEADVLRFDLFGSDDQMVLNDVGGGDLSKIDEIEFGNTFFKGNLRLEHRLSEDGRLLFAAGGGWQGVTAEVGDRFVERDRLWTTTWRAELRQRLTPWLETVAGVDAEWIPRADVRVTAGSLNPPGQIGNDTNDTLTPNRFRMEMSGYEAGVFAEASIQPTRWLRLVPGVRADVHRSLRTLAWVDPRLAARLELGPSTALKGGVGLYHQAPPLAYMTEEWGNPALREEGAWQYSVGVERKLGAHLSLDVELYAKRLFDLAIPSSAIVRRDGQDVREQFRSAGTGSAYGGELLLRYDPDGRFFGWIAYSLSRSERDEDTSGDTLQDEGSAYDQPHNLVAVGTVELPELWDGLSAGFRLRYTSGNPYERYRAAIYDADTDEWEPISTGRLDSRAPAFFQLDVRVDKKWTYPLWTLAAYLEVQNVTNRQNAEFPAYNFDYSKQDWVSGIGFFPAFGVRAEY